ncbi:MAG: hypothetical protein MHPSP_004455, partial [Paramarteilia canceri]
MWSSSLRASIKTGCLPTTELQTSTGSSKQLLFGRTRKTEEKNARLLVFDVFSNSFSLADFSEIVSATNFLHINSELENDRKKFIVFCKGACSLSCLKHLG